MDILVRIFLLLYRHNKGQDNIVNIKMYQDQQIKKDLMNIFIHIFDDLNRNMLE
jgi:hypothetical protein